MFGQLNNSVDCWGRAWVPLRLLSGALYKLKLLSLVFSYTTRLDRTYATGIIRVFSQLNKTVRGAVLGAAVWGTVQDKIAVSGIFVSTFI